MLTPPQVERKERFVMQHSLMGLTFLFCASTAFASAMDTRGSLKQESIQRLNQQAVTQIESGLTTQNAHGLRASLTDLSDCSVGDNTCVDEKLMAIRKNLSLIYDLAKQMAREKLN